MLKHVHANIPYKQLVFLLYFCFIRFTNSSFALFISAGVMWEKCKYTRLSFKFIVVHWMSPAMWHFSLLRYESKALCSILCYTHCQPNNSEQSSPTEKQCTYSVSPLQTIESTLQYCCHICYWAYRYYHSTEATGVYSWCKLLWALRIFSMNI